MQISVIEEKENPLLNRRELQIKIEHPAGTPARIEVKNRVAAELKVEPQQVIVRSMKTSFGKRETVAAVKIYQSAESAQQIEADYVLKRNAAPAEASATEGEKSEDK
jgi:small subunit ribosomal protein S24e